MVTKSTYLNLFLVGIIVIIGAKCDNDNNTILGVPITDYYDSCNYEKYSFGQMITISDPNNKFMVTLPLEWDIRENYSDSVYGLQAGNFLSIPIEKMDRMFFGVSGYSTDLTLENYYLNELKILKKEPSIHLQETGKTFINEVESYWIKFSVNKEAFNMVVYIKHPKLNDVYLLQASAYHPERYEIKLCYMKRLFNSFELTKNN